MSAKFKISITPHPGVLVSGAHKPLTKDRWGTCRGLLLDPDEDKKNVFILKIQTAFYRQIFRYINSSIYFI